MELSQRLFGRGEELFLCYMQKGTFQMIFKLSNIIFGMSALSKTLDIVKIIQHKEKKFIVTTQANWVSLANHSTVLGLNFSAEK